MTDPNRRQNRRTIEGVHFLRLEGSALERARMHAELVREEIPTGVLPYLAEKNEWLIRRAPGITQWKPAQELVVWFYHRVVAPLLYRRMTPEYRKISREIAQVAGVPARHVYEAVLQSEGFMLLSRLSIMQHLLRDLEYQALPACTSGVVLQDWTEEKKGPLHARNLDYPVVGPWERHPTVLFHEPGEAGEIPYVSVTSAGVHTGGLTSMNREGLTLATHAHFGRKIQYRGRPVVVIGEEVIKRAKTLGEAVDVVRRMPRIANWAFVISSARENDAIVIEMTPNAIGVRHADDGFLAHSNYFHTQESSRFEAHVAGAVWEDFVSRVCRVRQVLEPRRGQVTVHDMARMLADQTDPVSGREKALGNAIAVIPSVKSVVFEPGSQRLWVSSRRESPTSHGEFLGVDVDRFWREGSESGGLTGRLPAAEKAFRPELREAVRHYRDAYRAWHIDHHNPRYREDTLESLRRAVAALPDDGNLRLLNGLVAFKFQNFDEAEGCFEHARQSGLMGHAAKVCDLYLARCFDLKGRREEAKILYRKHLGDSEPKLRRACRDGVSRSYRRSRTRTIMLDLQFADTLHY